MNNNAKYNLEFEFIYSNIHAILEKNDILE